MDLLGKILFQLDAVTPDPSFREIKVALNKFAGGTPKCIRIFQQEKPVAFPQFVHPCKPDLSHTRAARKRIAQIAKKTGFAEGDYSHEEAKTKLNTLKEALVAEINSEVKTLDYGRALPLSIARIDTLINEIEFQRIMLKEAGALEVDYDRVETLSAHENDYVRHYGSYQYLIEKLVQLQPEGKEELDSEKCKYLLEFIRELRAFQNSSDYLHYGVAEMRMNVRHDLIVELHQEEKIEEKAKKFNEERTQISLGQTGNSQDEILIPNDSLEKFMDDLDNAFSEDLGFKFENMISLLELLSNWPRYLDNVEEATSYSVTIDKITEAFLLKHQNLTRDEIRLIINFLTLRSEDILRVPDQPEECADIPIWESNKRPARYTLRPLVLIGDRYYWGAHSARRSGIIWSGGVGSGNFPVDLQGTATQKVLEEIRSLLGKALENKVHEIVSRYTQHAQKNVRLHKINKKSGHPPDLGDYDNLVFFPEKGVVLNIECKNIPQVRCIKDSKRLREKIFGVPGEKEGYLRQVKRRQKYLCENLRSIADDLGWILDFENLPKVIPVFLTQNSDWWTKHQANDVEVEFLQIALLGDFIEEL